ncbi:MAG: DUF58 domain-containing protein [Chloracidobacterium sp.]|uniref:DUF58 domain-containing protein n=1 Tax=Chloracidobacterium validum TaxID=2821543 RepID=A0ABX8B7X0_9BACT|nr:DUF58 domain-containing protein [Chloracidobacterium validum]QUW03038.1 DUF58 domain-containing protein [Chloracidobacterium validum]
MLHRLRDRLATPSFRAELKQAAVAFVITSLLFGGSFLSLFLAFTAQFLWVYEIAQALFIASLVLALLGGLYIVPKLARRVRMELSRLDISYAPTQETAFFVLITVIVALSAFNTGNNLLYLIFAVLISVIVASGIVSESMLRGLSVGLRFPEHIYAGQATLLDVSVANEKYLVPSMSLTVGMRLTQKAGAPVAATDKRGQRRWWGKPKAAPSKLDNLAHFVIAGPRAKVRQTVEHTFPARGQYDIVGFTITTKFPFGFLQKTRRFAASGVITVYPAVDAAVPLPAGLSDALGARETNQRGLGADLYAIRQYRDGDRRRDIDWKATAKTRKLMVRDRMREDDRRVTIRFDPCPGRELTADDRAAFEAGVAQAASLVTRLAKSGTLVRLVTPNATTEFGNTPRHTHDMLRLLAVIEPGDGVADGKEAPERRRRMVREASPEVVFAWNGQPASGAVVAKISFDELRTASTAS